MRHFLRLDALDRSALDEIFAVADDYEAGRGPAYDGAAALFFPPGSIRTRGSFEVGLQRMGLRTVVFPPETLDKPEAHEDVAGYLAQFCDVTVVRHGEIGVLDALAAPDHLPVVNAMTGVNHPCEILSDLWALRRRGLDITALRYAVVGVAESNIVRSWFEAARAFGLDMVQACPLGMEVPGAEHSDSILDAVRGADVIATDPPGPFREAMAPFQVTAEVLAAAKPDCLLDPCPPFFRGREVSAEAIASPHFVGYDFKRALLPVQQAVVSWCLAGGR